MNSRQGHLITSTLLPIIVILFSLVICGIILWLLGFDTINTLYHMINTTFGSFAGFSRTLRWSTPLILLALSVSFSFKVGMFNLGAQGQFWVGAFAAAWMCLTFPNLSKFVVIPFAIIFAMAVGAFWSVIPGFLRVRFGPSANVIISSLMMNYIALQLTNYFVRVPYNDPTSTGKVMATQVISSNFHMPYIFTTTNLSAGILIAIIFCIIAYIFYKHTTLGYEIKLVGSNSRFAETSGINNGYVILRAMFISGAIAGLAGALEIMGPVGRFVSNFNSDLGFTGITVSIISNNNPIGIIISGIFFGALKTGLLGIRILTDTPRVIVVMLEGLIVFLITIKLFQKNYLSR